MIDWGREIDADTPLQLLQELEARADDITAILVVARVKNEEYNINIRGKTNVLELVGELHWLEQQLLSRLPGRWESEQAPQ